MNFSQYFNSLFFVFIFGTSQISYAQTREINTLKTGWKFNKGLIVDASSVSFDDSGWQNVDVPHDWAIYGPFDKEIDKQTIAIVQNGETIASEKTGRTGALPHIGEAWYRNKFSLPDYDKDKKVLILFEGAMSEPKVFINGKKVGEWNYGYSYFYFDISDYVYPDKNNTLAVQLTNRELSSRWYPGAGLYRNVRIIVKNRESIDQWGTFIKTPIISSELAQVNIRTKVSGTDLRLVTNIIDHDGNILNSNKTETIFGNKFEQNVAVSNPKLWSPETPYLYTAISKLYNGEELKDEVSTRFGIREIKYEQHNGFSLNGEVRKFKGVCLHHDLGPLGTAINKSALKRQLRILKDMGCNAIRSSHNMPSLEQL